MLRLSLYPMKLHFGQNRFTTDDNRHYRLIFHRHPEGAKSKEVANHHPEAANKYEQKLVSVMKSQFSPMKAEVIKYYTALDEKNTAEESLGYANSLNKKDEVFRKNKKIIRNLKQDNRQGTRKEARQLKEEGRRLDAQLSRMKDVFDPAFEGLRDELRGQKKELQSMREKYAAQSSTSEELSAANRDILGKMMALDADKNGPAVDALLSYKQENLRKSDMKKVTKEAIRTQQDYVNRLEKVYLNFKPFYEALQSKSDKARFLGKLYKGRNPDMSLEEALAFTETHASNIEKREAQNRKAKETKKAQLKIETEGDFKEIIKLQKTTIGNIEKEIDKIDAEIHRQEELPYQTEAVDDEIARLQQRKDELRLKLASNQKTLKDKTSEKVKRWGTELEKKAENFAIKQATALHKVNHKIQDLQDQINRSPEDSSLRNQLEKFEKLKFNIESGNPISDFPSEVAFDEYSKSVKSLRAEKDRYNAFIDALNKKEIPFTPYQPETAFTAEQAQDRADKRRSYEKKQASRKEARRIDRAAQAKVDEKSEKFTTSEAYGAMDLLRSQLRYLNGDINVLNAKLARVNRRIAERTQNGDNCTAEYAEREQYREQLKLKHQERAALQREIAATDQSLDKTKTTILSDLKREVDTARGDKEQTLADLEVARRELARDPDNASLKRQVASLETRFNQQKSDYLAAKRTYDRVKRKLNYLDRQQTRWSGLVRAPQYRRGYEFDDNFDEGYYDENGDYIYREGYGRYDYFDYGDDGRPYGRRLSRRNSKRNPADYERSRTDDLTKNNQDKSERGNLEYNPYEKADTPVDENRRLSKRSKKYRALPDNVRKVIEDNPHMITPVTHSKSGYKFPEGQIIVAITPARETSKNSSNMKYYSERYYRVRSDGKFEWVGKRSGDYRLGPNKNETFGFRTRYEPEDLHHFIRVDLPNMFAHEDDYADADQYLENIFDQYSKKGSKGEYNIVRDISHTPPFKISVSPYNNNKNVLNDHVARFSYNPVERSWTLDKVDLSKNELEALKKQGVNIDGPIKQEDFDKMIMNWAKKDRPDFDNKAPSFGTVMNNAWQGVKKGVSSFFSWVGGLFS